MDKKNNKNKKTDIFSGNNPLWLIAHLLIVNLVLNVYLLLQGGFKMQT